MKFRTLYNCNDPEFEKPVADCSGPSQTLQQFKDEADINNLIDRYRKTGAFYDALTLMKGEKRVPVFEDVSELPDYQTAQNTIVMANEMFMQIPAKVRAQFDNDPALFLAFVSDPANKQKCYDMGILKDDTLPIANPDDFQTVKPITPSSGGAGDESPANASSSEAVPAS